MDLSPLEITLGGGFVSLATGIAVHHTLKCRFVTREEFMPVKQDIGKIFRMLRALIVHSEIPKETQEEIINERGGDR